MPSSTSPISVARRRASASYATEPPFDLDPNDVAPGAPPRRHDTERPELVASLVIVRPEQRSRDTFVARRVRRRDRLMARFATGRLDNELARRVAPETRVALALTPSSRC